MNDLDNRINQARMNLKFLEFEKQIGECGQMEDGMNEYERFIKYIILNQIAKILGENNVVNVSGEKLMEYVDEMYNKIDAAQEVDL